MCCRTFKLWIVALTALSLYRSAPAAEPVQAPPEDRYYVFAGGCSRSIELRAAFDDAQSACHYTAKLRADPAFGPWTRHLGVTDANDPFSASRHFWREEDDDSYGVYVLSNNAWRLKKSTNNGKEADSLATRLRDEGRMVEIVVHVAKR